AQVAPEGLERHRGVTWSGGDDRCIERANGDPGDEVRMDSSLLQRVNYPALECAERATPLKDQDCLNRCSVERETGIRQFCLRAGDIAAVRDQRAGGLGVHV